MVTHPVFLKDSSIFDGSSAKNLDGEDPPFFGVLGPFSCNVDSEAWTAASPIAGSRASWSTRKRPRGPSTSACRRSGNRVVNSG